MDASSLGTLSLAYSRLQAHDYFIFFDLPHHDQVRLCVQDSLPATPTKGGKGSGLRSLVPRPRPHKEGKGSGDYWLVVLSQQSYF